MPDAVHDFALVTLGVHLFDNCDLEALGEAAAARNRGSSCSTAAPLPIRGGTGRRSIRSRRSDRSHGCSLIRTRPRAHAGANAWPSLSGSPPLSVRSCSARARRRRNSSAVHLNPVIAKLVEGKTVYGLNTGDLSLAYAREVARAPVDFVYVDMEHNPLDFPALHMFLMGMTDKATVLKKGNLQPNVALFARFPPEADESAVGGQTGARHRAARRHLQRRRHAGAGADRGQEHAVSADEGTRSTASRTACAAPPRPTRRGSGGSAARSTSGTPICGRSIQTATCWRR